MIYNQKEPMVSIICNTYNHEKYIRDALDGFLGQVTNFPVEILVMDDASTDNTAQIIKEYELRFPESIKPIYQTENQYSQGLRPGVQNRKRARGKYVALCEGDDFWIDCYKLQKQVDYMESNPSCTFCFTNGKTLTSKGYVDHIIPWVKDYRWDSGRVDFDPGQIELLGYIPTASFLFRRCFELPEVTEGAFRGDCYIKLSMTNYGYAHLINEPCVVYRRTVEDSATRKWQNDAERFVKTCDSFIQLYSDMKGITGHKYDDVFEYRIVQWEISKYRTLNRKSELRDLATNGSLRALKYSRLSTRIKTYVLCTMPWSESIIQRIKDVIKRTR